MFSTIDLPGAVETDPSGINDRGEIVGAIDDTQGATHGFFRDRKGRFTVIDVPGAAPFTSLFGINNRGEIVGQHLHPSGTVPGFLLSRAVFTTIDPPGDELATIVADINDRGQKVGSALNPVSDGDGG